MSDQVKLFSGAAIAVALLYALPLMVASTRDGKLLYAETPDDTLYEARVIELARGGGLGNPYLAEHQCSPRYMPEMIERLFASIANVSHLSPLTVVSISRVVVPTLIFLLICALGIALGMNAPGACFAGFLATLAPSIGLGPYTLRYFRVISPSTHVLLLVAALVLVCAAWQKPSWRSGAAAAIALGVLFYVPLYYWSCAVGGTVLLALFGRPAVRGVLLSAVVVGLAIGSVALVRSAQLAGDPLVRETLARLSLMVPGRSPELGAMPRFLLGIASIAVGWWFARKGYLWAQFVLPFCVAGTLMIVQNMITNRQIQSYHMINCLIPLWAVLVAGAFQLLPAKRGAMTFVGMVLLFCLGLTIQISGYRFWQRNIGQEPELYSLDTLMPRTVQWLNHSSPPGSVILTRDSISSSLPLFTRNRLFSAHYIFQYVISNRELELRMNTAKSWKPGTSLPYRADYFLGLGADCRDLPAQGMVFRDVPEGTCVFPIAR